MQAKDAIGRTWQMSTIQVDFNLPERFGLEYQASDGTRQRPVMIHRALFGSIERFFAVLLEHYAGAFPPWLAPVQVAVLNITDSQCDYAQNVANMLKNQGLRVESDLRNEKITYKIREHSLQKVPYILVAGDKEKAGGTVAVRARGNRDLGTMTLDDFAQKLRHDIAARA